MGIKTSTYGSVTLTGNAAKIFEKQFLNSQIKLNPKAQKSLETGRRLLKKSKSPKANLKIKVD